jgi:hypothetical protein
VFLVNLPMCAIVIAGAFRLLDGDRRQGPLTNFDGLGAILVTGGMLLLVYALVEAPDVGWGEGRTIAELAGASALLLAFAVQEWRHRNPLFPFSILRVSGLAAADATQVIANAGFYAMFVFLTLYMQTVLGYTPIEAGIAYVPVTIAVGIASGVSTKLLPRVGTRPLITRLMTWRKPSSSTPPTSASRWASRAETCGAAQTPGAGGAGQSKRDGRRPEPGAGIASRSRSQTSTVEVEALREAWAGFRGDIVTGRGGSQILLEEPSGNPIELFQPAGA